MFDGSKLIQTRDNWFQQKPIGVVIQDSYNNISFPIDIIQIDNNKINLNIITDRFFTLYAQAYKTDNILPWHYVVEFYNENYVVHNTRPTNLKYPKTILDTIDDSQDKKIISDDTKRILDSSLQIEEMIHVLIIGDSTADVYGRKLYKAISEYAIIPTGRNGLFSPSIGNNVNFLNLGYKFKPDLLRNYINV